MPRTRSGRKRNDGNPGRTTVVKMKKTLETCPDQSTECCTDSETAETNCPNSVSTESKEMDLVATLSEKKESISRTIQTKILNIQRLKAHIVEARKTRTRNQSEIRCASHTVISQFGQKKKQLMDAIDRVSEKQFGLLSDDVHKHKTAIELANQNMVVLKKILEDDDLMEAYPAHENLLTGHTEDEDRVVRLIRDVSVSQDTDNIKKSVEDISLGQLDRTFQDLHDRSSRPKLLNTTTVALKTNRFSQNADVYDIVVLDVEGIKTIVVSDDSNCSVKSFYVRNGESCHSEYSVPFPHDIIHLEQNKVLVSYTPGESFNSYILRLAVTPDLICLADIRTSSCHKGLRRLTPSTLVGRHSHGSINILNMKGKALKTARSPDKKDFFNKMCVTRTGNILVCNWKRKSLVCLTPQGDILWEQVPDEDGAFIKPSDVKTTTTGDILLADYETSRVIQLTESGRFVKDILVSEDGLAPPTALYLYNDRHLFVGGGGEVKEYLLP